MNVTGRLSPGAILGATFGIFFLPVLLVGLFPAQLDTVIEKSTYLVFHNFAEFFSIMVSLTVFSVGWFTFDQSRDRHTLFLGTAFLAVGLLDFMHCMSNAAMPDFISPNSTNKSTQLWLAARLFDSSALLSSAFIYPETRSKLLSKWALLLSALTVTGLVFAGVVWFPEYLPATAIPGVGLTPLKRVLEFLVILLLFAAFVAYWKRMKRTGNRHLVYYLAAFIICMFSEAFFASYKTGFDTYNVLGHVYKVIAFFLIYKGVFISTVNRPYMKLSDAMAELRRDSVSLSVLEKEVAERKRVEEQLLVTLESIGDGFFACDSNWQFVYVNAPAERILNIHREEVIGKNHWEIFPLTVGTNLDVEYRRAAAGEIRDFENFYEPWGKWFHNRCFPREGGGISIYFEDITARKQAEQALRDSETRLHRFYESRLLGVIFWNMDGKITDANNRFLEMVGYDRSELVEGSIDWVSMTPPEYRHQDEISSKELKETGANKEPFEKEYIRKDGSRLPVIVASAMIDEERFNGVAFVLDITKRKRMEEILRENEQKIRFHLENSPLAVVEWDKDFIITQWSVAAEQTFGWLAGEVIGTGLNTLNLIYEEDIPLVNETMTRLTSGKENTVISTNRNYTKAGTVIECTWYNSVLLDEKGQLSSVMSLVQDITVRKQAEERLQASLYEKEVLLKEIHHRVKNNLQVISSLVNLQADTIENPEVRDLFRDVRDRVRSMALVHEKLYHSESLANVRFDEYAGSLMNYLWHAYGSSAAAIRLTLDLQPISLSVEKAVPCGLILNELVSNALKHAFRGRSDGEVTTALHKTPDGSICLRIGDNGIGMPPGLDWRQSSSLGLRLVLMLAGQLNAAVEMNSEHGTEFRISFMLPEEVKDEEQKHD